MADQLIERKLMCALTDAELVSRGRMMAELFATIDSVEAARSEAMKNFKARLTGLNEEQRKLGRALEEKQEERLLTCMVTFHSPEVGIKRIVRSDTGEVVEEVPMTDAEKQIPLFGRGEPAAKPKNESMVEIVDFAGKPPKAPAKSKVTRETRQ